MGRTDKRTREDRAIQPLDAGWLSFAIYESENDASKYRNINININIEIEI